MNDQLEPLLALQGVDDELQTLERRLTALAPRLSALDGERQTALRSLESARAAVEREDERYRHLNERAAEFRRINERAVSQLDKVSKAHHATAANAQLDISRRALTDAEAEQTTSGHRLATLRAAAELAEERLATLDASQAEVRAQVAEEQQAIEREMAGVRARRAEQARMVEARLLMRYERVRGRRRSTAVFALHNFTCGSCDTAIATQRRAAVAAGLIDVCESCGVLLYQPPAQVPAEAGAA